MTKYIAITGCSSGFGLKLVGLFLKDGWHVIAGLRSAKERSGLFTAEQAAHPGQLSLVDCDLLEGRSIAHFCQEVKRLTGGDLHALVNNAGIGQFGPAELTDSSLLRETMETNFFGTVAITRELLPLLRKTKGRIIVVSSIMGVCGFPLSSTYCASKFALEGYFESLYYELRDFGVKVCLVEPGGHRTDFLKNARTKNSGDPQTGSKSPYASMVKGYREMQRRIETRKPTPADHVVDRIVFLVKNPNPPLRSYCGKDAQIMRVVHKLVPRNLLVGTLRFLYGNMLAKFGSQTSSATNTVTGPGGDFQ